MLKERCMHGLSTNMILRSMFVEAHDAEVHVPRRWSAYLKTASFLCPLLTGAVAAHAQETDGWFYGGSLGILRQDVPSPSDARSNGVSVMARVGRGVAPHVALVGDLSWL